MRILLDDCFIFFDVEVCSVISFTSWYIVNMRDAVQMRDSAILIC